MNAIEVIARGIASVQKKSWDDLKPKSRKYFEDCALAAITEMNKSTDIEKDMTVKDILRQAALFKLGRP